MMIKRLQLLLLCAPLLAALGGCYESPDVTVYEPGVYKGKPDPLLEKSRSKERQQQLVERFNAVQTDR